MAHFAKLGLNSKVIEVLLVDNNELLDSNSNEQEVKGVDFLIKLTGYHFWAQTSYNTYGGVHSNGGTPFRKNYAGKGYTYDETRNAFIAPQPYPSWTLNEDTCIWESPTPYPDDGEMYTWNEETLTWESE
jgi:hypothetical protein